MGQNISIRQWNPLRHGRTRREDEVTVPNNQQTNSIAPNVERKADILKLNIDCLEDTFDYLPLEDLINIGETCKRMQLVAGYCFSQNYSGEAIWSIENDFRLNPHSWTMDMIHADYRSFFSFTISVKHFAPFIRLIQINSCKGFEYLLCAQSKLRRLKQIRISCMKLTQTEVDRMADVLSKVEVLSFYDCTLNVNELIANCPNLRRLELNECVTDLNWLDGKCPMLEYFKFQPRDMETIEKIPVFLKHNPNICKFATTANLFCWAARDFMENADDIKLDEFAIRFDYYTTVGFGPFCELLNALYERGVYKRLQMYVWGESLQEMIDQLAKVNGFTKLFICPQRLVTIPTLKSLEELYVNNSAKIIDTENMVNRLINLRRISFERANFNDVMPFVRRAPQLDKIRVDYLNGGIRFNQGTNIIDLRALNGERQQLPNARKITLYVQEKIYLATKWAMKETDLELIRLKRIESFEWQHDFN